MLVQLKALFQPIEVGTPSCTVLETWPCNKYSREKALNRSDNIVGKLVRRAEPSTEFTYTQETPTI